MSTRVRVAFDVDVVEGDPQKVVDALFEHRKKVVDYTVNVVLANHDETEAMKVRGVGSNCHLHPNEEHDLPCVPCDRYSRKLKLSRLT